MRVTKLQKTTDIGIIHYPEIRPESRLLGDIQVCSFDINYSMIPVTFKALKH